MTISPARAPRKQAGDASSRQAALLVLCLGELLIVLDKPAEAPGACRL